MERHFSVTEVHDHTVFGQSGVLGKHIRQPPYPPIDGGRLRAFHLRVAWGDAPEPRGILPVERVEVAVEHSADWLASDFAFTQVRTAIDWRINPLFRRRFLSNTLDLQAVAGGALGTLPLQRYGVVEASPLPFTPFNALRTLDDRQTVLRRRGIDLRTPDGVHHEIGISVNGLLCDRLRVDCATRLDRQAYSIGLSLLRFI